MYISISLLVSLGMLAAALYFDSLSKQVKVKLELFKSQCREELARLEAEDQKDSLRYEMQLIAFPIPLSVMRLTQEIKSAEENQSEKYKLAETVRRLRKHHLIANKMNPNQ